MIALHYIEKDVKEYDAKELDNEREKQIISLMSKYLKKMQRKTKNHWLEGGALNRRTGTLKSSIYIGIPKKIGKGLFRGSIGIGSRINPVNRVPAYVYGSAWEGWSPLPRRYNKNIRAKKFIEPSFEEYFKEFEKDLANIKVM